MLVNLSAAGNATIADAQGVGTILDDDSPLPSLSIGDVTVTEGNAASVNAIFTVSACRRGQHGITVRVTAATANSDRDGSGRLHRGVGDTVVSSAGDRRRRRSRCLIAGDLLDEIERDILRQSDAAGQRHHRRRPGRRHHHRQRCAAHLSINDVTVTEGNSGSVNAHASPSSLSAGERPDRHRQRRHGQRHSRRAGPTTRRRHGDAVTLRRRARRRRPFSRAGARRRRWTKSNETFFVNLSSAGQRHDLDGEGVGTITDDDADAVAVASTTSRSPKATAAP